MSLTCNSCGQKQELITQYVKLIKLLKSKCQKSIKSTLRSQSFSSHSIFETSGSNVQSSSSNIGPSQFESYKEPTMSRFGDQKTESLRLALTIISNRTKKALLKQSLDNIKAAAKIYEHETAILSQFDLFPPTLSTPLSSIVEQTLSYGKELQTVNSPSVLSLKQLHFKTFNLQSLNIKFEQAIFRLEEQMEELEKRFIKQTQKKRESLQAVAEELREKNDFIAELQHTIKQYQKLSGKNFQKLCVENILIEDELELKRACLRLENINQKLNCDIRNAQSKISDLNSDILSVKKENFSLKNEINELKEHRFDLVNEINKIHQLGETYANLCHKLNLKLQKIKLTEKSGAQILKLSSKVNSILSSGDICSSKNTEASSDSSPLSRKSSLRELQSQQKLQQIFSFIFNIHLEDYKMTNEEIFDEDELNLLKLHKNSYLNSVHNQNPQTQQTAQKLINKANLNDTDQIYFIQSPRINVENSFFNVLESRTTSQSALCQRVRIINLEAEKSKLIEKISGLKKIHMHIRDVFLNFLKTIDFTNMKIQTSQILEIIFEVFQYSEDEKAMLFKEKKKKFWGIL